MKKKTTRRAPAKKTTRRTTSRASEQLLMLPFSFRRVIFITTAIALFLGVVVYFNKSDINKAVAGMSITQGLYAQARVELPKVDGAVSYNVYFKQKSSGTYANVARDIPANLSAYTISYLKKGEAYQYKIAAVNASGAEFYWTDESDLTNIESM